MKLSCIDTCPLSKRGGCLGVRRRPKADGLFLRGDTAMPSVNEPPTQFGYDYSLQGRSDDHRRGHAIIQRERERCCNTGAYFVPYEGHSTAVGTNEACWVEGLAIL